MKYKQLFKMPTPVTINGRTSSITNSFINGIIPCIIPTDEEIITVLSILGMNEDNICCAYCGKEYTEWDHFRPLVENKRPTGYISEINNLVPACGKCNQSKGNSYWKTWMNSNAPLSPFNLKIEDLSERVKKLEEYEKWSNPIKINFEEIVGTNKWQEHWNNCELLHKQMNESQILSDDIKSIIKKHILSEKIDKNKYCILNIEKPKIINKKILKDFPNKKVGEIAQIDLKNLLESNQCDSDIINFLQNKEYSKSMFYVNFPILVKIENIDEKKSKMIDNLGYSRYYSEPLYINDEIYLLTSQWYDRNKTYLIKWINTQLTKIS